MKRVFLLTTAMLVWGGSVVAGELKIAVPVDDFRQIKSRLETLERENILLKQGVGSEPAAKVSPASEEVQGRLQAEENENRRLRQELNAMKSQERQPQAKVEMQARLEAVERENRQLKEAQGRLADKGSSGDDAGLAGRLQLAENENNKLQQEVRSLKDGGLEALFKENKTSARELYFLKKKKSLGHVYKF